MRRSRPSPQGSLELYGPEFRPRYFESRLTVLNPAGRIGLITLWSKTDYIQSILQDLDADLQNIAVIGNLYGNGIPQLLRNLLFNPQIRDLVICGADRSGSADDLIAFFERGIEKKMHLGTEVTRIVGRNRTIDDMVAPADFVEKPRFERVGDLRTHESREALRTYLQSFECGEPLTSERIIGELPEVSITHFPSEARSHTIVKDAPLEAWRELVFRIVRFGHLAQLRKGDRQELQNVKVVVRYPQLDDRADLDQCGFSLDELLQYQDDMLIAELPDDQPYTYGNRIMKYYRSDMLEEFAQRLVKNPEDRDCYLSLWDTRRDVRAEDAPCLVALFFRVFDGQLTLSATYRTHNALDAWLKNVYGLMKVQETLANRSGLDAGPLTVISHSISVDPSRYDYAQRVANSKGFSIDIDPNGQFRITVDEDAGEIVALHLSEDGFPIHQYRSKKAERIQHEIARDCAVSDINHAIYVGRQLAKAELCLKTGEQFEES